MGENDNAQTKSLKNLNALVIGAGFGGIASAIELQSRGATVTVLESAPDMSRPGLCIPMDV